MYEVGVMLDVVFYNMFINGCIEVDDNIVVLDWFRRMCDVGIVFLVVSYIMLMKVFGCNG